MSGSLSSAAIAPLPPTACILPALSGGSGPALVRGWQTRSATSAQPAPQRLGDSARWISTTPLRSAILLDHGAKALFSEHRPVHNMHTVERVLLLDTHAVFVKSMH